MFRAQSKMKRQGPVFRNYGEFQEQQSIKPTQDRRWHSHSAHPKGRRWVERNEDDKKGGQGAEGKDLLGTVWCFINAISLNTQTALAAD